MSGAVGKEQAEASKADAAITTNLTELGLHG